MRICQLVCQGRSDHVGIGLNGLIQPDRHFGFSAQGWQGWPESTEGFAMRTFRPLLGLLFAIATLIWLPVATAQQSGELGYFRTYVDPAGIADLAPATTRFV